MTTEKEESVFSKQQTSLDRVTILNRLAEFKDRLNQFEEKLGKMEIQVGTLSTGQSIMATALTNAGLMTANGEPADLSKKAEAPSKKTINVEALTQQLKAQNKDSRTGKGPYFLATEEDNPNQAFKSLQAKIKGKGGAETFWSKKVGNILWKFWFFNNDSTKISWRKEEKTT